MDKTDTTILTVTVTVSPYDYTLAKDRVEREIQVKAPLDLLYENTISDRAILRVIRIALSEYRAKVDEKAHAEQEGEA